METNSKTKKEEHQLKDEQSKALYKAFEDWEKMTPAQRQVYWDLENEEKKESRVRTEISGQLEHSDTQTLTLEIQECFIS